MAGRLRCRVFEKEFAMLEARFPGVVAQTAADRVPGSREDINLHSQLASLAHSVRAVIQVGGD